mmetsp:Transcript_43018/g.63191  ORF Transcript_43018/g.63191 Transcript_43018/m.63191 type:complete len:86 (+) Transcript_43018:1119-1376(+)
MYGMLRLASLPLVSVLLNFITHLSVGGGKKTESTCVPPAKKTSMDSTFVNITLTFQRTKESNAPFLMVVHLELKNFVDPSEKIII